MTEVATTGTTRTETDSLGKIEIDAARTTAEEAAHSSHVRWSATSGRSTGAAATAATWTARSAARAGERKLHIAVAHRLDLSLLIGVQDLV